MGRTEHLPAGDPNIQATTTELRAPGEAHDDAHPRDTRTIVVAVTGLLVALAAFFIAFAPGA